MSERQTHDLSDETGQDWTLGSDRYGRFVLRWRWPIIIATLLVVAIASIGIFRLTFNPDTRSFFGPENPERILLDRMEAKYAKLTNVIFVLAPRNGDVFTLPSLRAIDELTQAGWQTPYVIRVESLTNYQELTAEGDDLQVAPVYNAKIQQTAETAAEVKRRVMRDRELVDRIVSSKADVTAVQVLITRPHDTPEEVTEIVDFVRRTADEFRASHPEIELRLTGGVLADRAFAQAGEEDSLTLMPAMTILIVLILWIGMRSLTVTAVTVLVIGLTVALSMGVYGWAGAVLNSASGSSPAVIMTLFFADCVHFVTSVMQQQARLGDREKAVAVAIRVNLMPTIIKTLTTIAGFLSLNFSDSPPLSELGNMVAVGSTFGCLLTVTFMPALLSLLPLPQRQVDNAEHRLMSRMADYIVVRQRKFLWGSLLAVPLLCAFIPRIEIDDNFVRYFDRDFPFRVDTEFMEKRLTGLNGLTFSVPAAGRDSVTDPAYLRKLDEFATWYRQQDHVIHVNTLADVMKRLNRAMNGDDPAFDRLPETRELAAQYLFLYELSLPPGHDLNTIIDVSRSESVVIVRLADVSSNSILALADAGEAWLKQNAPQYFADATGLSVVYAHITKRNIQAMFMGTLISVLVVSVIMIVALRSWRLGLISLVPNLTPAFMAFGLWGLFGGEVNLAISVVTAMTYGIVTDDTVHTVTKYRFARREHGLAPEAAVRETLVYTGSAVILSSVALGMGFALLGISNFNITALMGALSALIIIIAMVAELFMLPGLLLKFDRGERQ
ncbi:MAG: transporter [Alphaproteobacteria bacterium]|jgi:predicted RND superfamily exporter protein|nr:transporter [Alphaproteobacteria bacterium]